LLARRAAILRDSLQRLSPGLVFQDSSKILAFLKDPYRAAPVTLEALDSAQAKANVDLTEQRKKEFRDPASGETDLSKAIPIAAAETLLTGGATALPTLAVGAASFFVERAKDELAFGFITTLGRNVQNDALIAGMLPRSHTLIRRINTETFQSLMPVVRSSFVSDVADLPLRADTVLTLLKLPDAQKEEAKLYLQTVAIAYERGREIHGGTLPAIALSNLAGLEKEQLDHDQARLALRLVGTVAREYVAGGGEPMVRVLTRGDQAWLRRYFVALVGRELLASEPDSVSGQFMSILATRETDAVMLTSQIHAFRERAAEATATAATAAAVVTAAAEELKEGGDRLEGVDRTLASAVTVLSTLQVVSRFTHVPGEPTPPNLAVLDAGMEDAIRITQSLVDRDYLALVTWISHNPRFDLCWEASEQACATRMRYLGVAASLATARTAEEVSTVLRTASAPLGSYRAKRGRANQYLAPRTVSLVGYPSLAAYNHNTVEGDGIAKSYTGIGLPIGPEVSFGIPLGALSIFVPLVDFGPLLNDGFGIRDDAEAEFDTAEFVSPGIALVFNAFRGLPISMGVGITSARNPAYSQEGSQPSRVVRSLLFLGVDATLFNFRF
jgi:hypothetical protein